MSLSIEHFGHFFKDLWGYEPFPWQAQLARQVHDEDWPDCIDLPTGSGKTAAIDAAVFVLACQAKRSPAERTVGRRIFFTVNRRVIVDAAFDRAKELARRLLGAERGVLREVANALRVIGGDSNSPPLDIARLRGGIYRDRAWARSITQPIVICTTADQLGSRLLFRGYGVSASSAPIHAALCGCDSLVLLDEAHVTRAFCQTMLLVANYQKRHDTAPRMQFVQMTATPACKVGAPFALSDADRSHAILKARQEVAKPATLIKLSKSTPIVGEIVARAFNAVSESRKAIGVIVNRVQTAREIEDKIREEIGKRRAKDETFTAESHLVIGRMRPIDRDYLQEQLRPLVGPDRKPVLDSPVFVVATQCLEVGADYDFDALITECASIDALRQRFGRLNRRGCSIDVLAAIVTNQASLKDTDPIYGDAIRHTWEWLDSKKDDNEKVDFGIASFQPLWDEARAAPATHLDENCPKPLLSPTRNAAVLLPSHLDILCQTNPRPKLSPDVSYFIHGPERDNAEVSICWRADLDDDHVLWPATVQMLPPTSPECMTVPLSTLARWMRQDPAGDDADVPVQMDDKESESSGKRRVLVWRSADDIDITSDPRRLRPGDTIVIPTDVEDSLSLGHIPLPSEGELQLDIAERAYELVHLQRIVRLHRRIPLDLPEALPEAQRNSIQEQLLKYATSDGQSLSKAQIRELLGPLARGFSSGPEEIEYPRDKNGSLRGCLLRFNELLLPNLDQLQPSRDDDDGASSSVESTRLVTLDEHTENVATRVKQATDLLELDDDAPLYERAARLHDIGKADIRFVALLAGVTPYEAMELRALLAKSRKRGLSFAERRRQRRRAQLPRGFRHEMLSVQLIANKLLDIDSSIERDLLLHLIASHHGYARPFAPVVIDGADDEVLSIEYNGVTVTAEERMSWVPSHRLDSGIAERFWKLTREHGWWGLAWLESVLRLADQLASAAEMET